MMELRYVVRDRTIVDPFDGPTVCGTERVLQYRNLLSDEAKLGIQTRHDAEIAKHYEEWKDVPEDWEAKHSSRTMR